MRNVFCFLFFIFAPMLFAQVEVSKINLFPNLDQSKKFKRDVDNLLGNHLNEKSMGDILLKIFYKHQIQNPYYVLDKTELSVYGVYPEAIKGVKFITSGKKIPFDFEFIFQLCILLLVFIFIPQSLFMRVRFKDENSPLRPNLTKNNIINMVKKYIDF